MAGRYEFLLQLMQTKEQEVLELLGSVTQALTQDENKKQELITYKEEYLEGQAAVGKKAASLMKQNAHFIVQLDIAIVQQAERIKLHQDRRHQVLELYASVRSKRLLFEKLVKRDQQEQLVMEEKRMQQFINDTASRLASLKAS